MGILTHMDIQIISCYSRAVSALLRSLIRECLEYCVAAHIPFIECETSCEF
jgi:hypothetical protein